MIEWVFALGVSHFLHFETSVQHSKQTLTFFFFFYFFRSPHFSALFASSWAGCLLHHFQKYACNLTGLTVPVSQPASCQRELKKCSLKGAVYQKQECFLTMVRDVCEAQGRPGSPMKTAFQIQSKCM